MLHSIMLHINVIIDIHYTNVMLNNFGNKYFLFDINEQQRNNKMSKHVILRFNLLI
jgi:hypothetical protein